MELRAKWKLNKRLRAPRSVRYRRRCYSKAIAVIRAVGDPALRGEASHEEMSRIQIAVFAILVAWATFFSVAPLRGLFWLPPGSFGLTTDSSLTVVNVDADGAAYPAGIRVGDRFNAATTSFEDRLYLQNLRNPAPGRSLKLQVRGKSAWHVVNLGAVSQAPGYEAADYIYYFVFVFIDLMIVLVGSIILLVHPSTMTWAFLLYCVGVLPGLFFISFWLPPWLNFGASAFGDALRSVGYGAFLLFCVRVPNDAPVGRWRYVQSLVAPFVTVGLLVCSVVINISIIGVVHADLVAGRVQTGISSAAYVVGMLALVATFCRERARERKRVGWIIAGFAIGLGSIEGANVANLFGPLFPAIPPTPSLLAFMPKLLPMAIPLSVAYAVVRHHALNVGFIAKRTIVYGLLLIVGLGAFIILDVLVTKRFAHNQFEVGIDIALALTIGLTFQFFHPRAIRTIDRVFLPERYQAAIALDKLRTTLGRVGNDDDGPNRAVEALAKELMISSLALFRKLPDGGFVRYASTGWPPGSVWHVFAGDPLLQSFATTARVKSIDDRDIGLLNFPPEPAQPKLGMSILPQSAAASLMLVGAHANGRLPDRDEVRSIGSLLRDFVIVGTKIDERVTPMRVSRLVS